MKELPRVASGPLLLVAGAVALGAIDALFLAITTGYFGAGYNSPLLRGVASLGAFAASGMLLDGFLLATLFSIALLAARMVRIEGPARLAFAGAIALYLPVAFFIVSHRIHRTFGQVVGFDVLIQLAGGRPGDAALEAATEAPGTVLLIAGLLAGILGGVHGVRRAEPWFSRRVVLVPPSARGLAATIGVTALLGLATLVASQRAFATLAYGLEHKPSARLLLLVARLATDVDFDGYGLGSRPPDAAPFDGTRHPFALEIPGNDIDENGVGGDLPGTFEVPRPIQPPREVAGARRPSFLLIFLESFRGDLVGLRYGDREVTPVLNELSRQGASSQCAFAHNPLTWPSRAALFQGRIAPIPGGRTLIDDFHDLGYRVAYFSGQNDMHGGSRTLVGFERADHFYDARSDAGQRTSRTSLPVSLQVSADVVLGRVGSYLEATASDPKPLFLYVNLVDNHFPYHHDGLERLLGVDPVSRAEIREKNARRVFETYLQASANVDRSIGELVALWDRYTGGAPLLVTADHGQSFYENGLLGHGQAVDDAQSRVPLIVVGIGGAWPEPLAVSDLRGLVLTHLFEAPARAHFRPDPTRTIFQHVGSLQHPILIALRSLEGASMWHFKESRGRDVDPSRGEPSAQLLEQAIWTWESLQLDTHERTAGQP